MEGLEKKKKYKVSVVQQQYNTFTSKQVKRILEC